VADLSDDINFLEAISFKRDDQDVLGDLKVEALRPIVLAYSSNMDRVHSIPAFIVNFAMWTAVGARAAGPVPLVTGIPEIDCECHDGDRGIQSFRESLQGMDDSVRTRDLAGQANLALCVGVNLVNTYVKAAGGSSVSHVAGKTGVQSVFYSMILNSYAAFETLAADLWVEAVNSKPSFAKKLKGDAASKSISLDKLSEYQYDIKDRIGELLKDTEKVSFQRLSNIADAYAFTFSEEEAINAGLKKNAGITQAEKVRHLIAHKGGRVDRSFLRQSVNWPEFSHAAENEYLAIDGHMVCSLVNSCITTAVNLIRLVERRLSARNGTDETTD